MLIEVGMTVHGSDGDVGTVSQVIADEAVDIFRGLILTHGLLPPRRVFVQADKVTGVAGRTVQVSLSRAEVEHAPPPPG